MSEFLLADIGGTTSRLAFASAGGKPERIVTVANDSVASPEAMIARCLDGAASRPRAGVLAIAGPVDGDEIALTNRSWRFRLSDLSARFGLRFRALNDFEALAWSLPRLGGGDTRALGAPVPDAAGVKVVVGPGTGLGVAALVPIGGSRAGSCGGSWHVVASEGGHASFGPAARDEEPVFAQLSAECGLISAEHLLSGPGLARLHRAVNPGVMKLTPEMILTQARAGNREARRTIALFVRLLGRFAGDMALIFKATGGVYLAGGVAMGLGTLLDARLFRAGFEAHPPHESLLAAIPTSLITCEEPGLLGCAAYAAQMADGDRS